MIVKTWVVENGQGHWKVTNGSQTIHCDDGELNETIRELSDETETQM